MLNGNFDLDNSAIEMDFESLNYQIITNYLLTLENNSYLDDHCIDPRFVVNF